MATKQINQLTAATAIENTDSIPLQTLGGVTKKFTPVEMNKWNDGRYTQKGEVKWESADGVGGETTVPVTLLLNRVYEFWIQTHSSMVSLAPSAGAQIFRSYINFGSYPGIENLTLVYYKYFDGEEEEKEGFLSVGLGNITSSAPVIKIIDLGEPI